MNNDLQHVLIEEKEIKEKVNILAEQIKKEYKDKNPIIICVLKGACIFFTDLIRRLDFPLEIDFITLSSYGNSTISNKFVRLQQDLSKDIKDRYVIVVEDIIDTGRTLLRLKEILKDRGAASVKIAALLNKPERREVDLVPDFEAFSIPNEFIVGYGLDYAEKYRNLPYIATLKPEIYNK